MCEPSPGSLQGLPRAIQAGTGSSGKEAASGRLRGACACTCRRSILAEAGVDR